MHVRSVPPKDREFVVFVSYSCQSHHGKDTQEIGVNDRTTHGVELDGLNNLLSVGLQQTEANERSQELATPIQMYDMI